MFFTLVASNGNQKNKITNINSIFRRCVVYYGEEYLSAYLELLVNAIVEVKFLFVTSKTPEKSTVCKGTIILISNDNKYDNNNNNC